MTSDQSQGLAGQAVVLSGLSVLMALTVGIGMTLWTGAAVGFQSFDLYEMIGAIGFITIFAWFFAVVALLFVALPALVVIRKKGWNQAIVPFACGGLLTGAASGLLFGFPMMNDLAGIFYFPIQGGLSGLIAACVWWKFVEAKLQERSK